MRGEIIELISIIVPIYNQEKYLNKSIKSVLNQTIGFENIELILVDDCSTDNSKEIIAKYSEKYENIKPIFLNKNSGSPSIPKNKGIEMSTTDYIMFFDPDDCLLNDICEVLYNEIINEKCEIVSGNSIFMINNIPYYDKVHTNPKEIIYPTNNYDDYKNFRCWGTLYDKKFLLKNNIQFINVKTNEDTYFVHKCFFNAKKICYINDYYGIIYFIRNTKTLTKTFSYDILDSTINAFTQIKELLKSMNITFEEDPFLSSVLTRLFEKWDTQRNEEIEIYMKMLNYIDYKIPNYLSPHIKIGEKLLKEKRFTLLHYYRILAGFLIKLPFIQKKINLRYHKLIKPNEQMYDVVSQFKD